MKQLKNRWYVAMAAVALAGILLSGCASAKPEPGVVFPCVADKKLESDIAKEAMLEEFSCVFKEWSGSETLHFQVAVKNVSDIPQRYKVNIFLANGKAVGGLIPRKTKKGLVQPGRTATFTYPVKDMGEMPKAINLMVRTMN